MQPGAARCCMDAPTPRRVPFHSHCLLLLFDNHLGTPGRPMCMSSSIVVSLCLRLLMTKTTGAACCVCCQDCVGVDCPMSPFYSDMACSGSSCSKRWSGHGNNADAVCVMVSNLSYQASNVTCDIQIAGVITRIDELPCIEPCKRTQQQLEIVCSTR